MRLSRLLNLSASSRFYRLSIPPITLGRYRTMASTSIAINKTAHAFTRTALEELLNRRFFYAPAFEIYGGVAGLYDYGPPGSSLHANILNEWRKHFIIEESMLELDTTIMTPAPVFETSGHVARFADWMVKDTKTGDVLRADHLVEGVLEARLKGDKEARGEAAEAVPESDKDKKKKKKVKSTAVKLEDSVVAEYESVLAQIDNYTGPELGQLIRKYTIVNPDTSNEVDEPIQFNLMFDSSIGPTGKIKGYLRPETAQGHFLNFSRLLAFNNGQIPFASAQIGRSFRNEISPRSGLLRVREFTMAEIEHYVDPLNKNHDRFSEIKDVKLRFLPKDVQAAGKSNISEITIGEAVSSKIVDNETLGYFLGRIYLFLAKIGIEPSRLRFRQHMANEMAHYAADCWDAEIETSYGWIECVGCADRSAYDLTVHSNATGKPLVARQLLPEPIITEKEVPSFNNKLWGKTFVKDAGKLKGLVEGLGEAELLKLKDELAAGTSVIKDADGTSFTLTPELLTIERKVFKQSVRDYTPNVIEPSFGIGRILYALLEHTYWAREQDAARGVLSLPPIVAPTKCLIVPLSANDAFTPLVREVTAKLRGAGVSARVDDSNATIGKRYSRNDELGTPYGVTLDFASVQNGTMTLRERDTTDQRIGKVDDVIEVVKDLVFGVTDWAGACERLEAYTGVQDL